MSFNPRLGKQSFLLNKDQKVIDFNFKIYKDTDVKVYLIPKGQFPNDTTDILTLATSYSVSVNGDSGGTVTLTSSVTVNKDDKLVIIRRLPVTRETQYVAGGTLYNDTLDNDQDYQTYLILDLYQDILGTLRLPLSASGESLVLENIEPNAYLRWNDTAQKILSDTKLPDAVEQVILLEQKVQQNADLASSSIITISTIFEQLGKTYLGEQATDPTKDFNDNPLLGGAVYYNSTYNKFRVYDGTKWNDAITIEKATEQDVIDATDNFKYVTPKALSVFAGGGDARIIFVRNGANTGYITTTPFNVSQHTFFGLFFDDTGQTSMSSTIDWRFKVLSTTTQKLEILDADIHTFLDGDMRVINEVGIVDPILRKSFKDLSVMVRGKLWLENKQFIFTTSNTSFDWNLSNIKDNIFTNTGVDIRNTITTIESKNASFYTDATDFYVKDIGFSGYMLIGDKNLLGAGGGNVFSDASDTRVYPLAIIITQTTDKINISLKGGFDGTLNFHLDQMTTELKNNHFII